MSVEVANESGERVDENALVALGRHVLSSMGVHPLAELSVVVVDEGSMATLHETWMDEPGPTDVLAFPMDELDSSGHRGAEDRDDEPTLLGDVVLCPAVARRQAASAGHSVQDELALLCTHGILHLLGYDHGGAEEEREMFATQARLLREWAGSPPGSGAMSR